MGGPLRNRPSYASVRNIDINIDIISRGRGWYAPNCTCSWSFNSSITAEMVYTTYVKQRILFYHEQGRKARRIRNLLLNESTRIYKFLLRVAKTGCISRRPGSGRPIKITREVKALVENWMQKDDETTACQIHGFLKELGNYTIIIITGTFDYVP